LESNLENADATEDNADDVCESLSDQEFAKWVKRNMKRPTVAGRDPGRAAIKTQRNPPGEEGIVFSRGSQL